MVAMDENKSTTFTRDCGVRAASRRRPPPVWSPRRIDTMVRLWNLGRTTAEVAAELGTTARAVECKLHKLRAAGHSIAHRRPAASARSTRARRRCLYCGAMFASSHIGNRLCPTCLEDGPFTGALV